MKISVLVTFSAVSFSLAGATPASAQFISQTDEWQPWQGCWHGRDASDGELLCIVPDGAGVRMVTVVDGAVKADSRIIADGVAHRSQSDGCTTVETARWSRDRHRVFLSSEMRCGQSAPRTVRGMLAFIGPDEWLSVQSVDSEDGTGTRSVRFLPAESANIPNSLAAALRSTRVMRISAVSEFSEEDVKEAGSYLDAGAVQEWLRTSDAPFQLADRSVSTDGSALYQLERMSRNVGYEPDVVRVVERPVYIVHSYGSRYYSNWWTPWGYDYYGWHVRPIVRINFPIVIRTGGWNDRDRYRGYTTWHNTRDDDWRRGRDDHSRYTGHSSNTDHSSYTGRSSDTDRSGSTDRSSDSRATRGGYTRGSAPAQPRTSAPPRTSSPPAPAPSRGVVTTTRTARARDQ